MKEYKLEGEVFQVDDRGGFVEVRHGGTVVGYVGVALDRGTNDFPYRFDFFRPHTGLFAFKARIRTEGFVTGGGATATLDDGLKHLCNGYLVEVKELRRQQEFDPEEARRLLHKQFEDLQ